MERVITVLTATYNRAHLLPDLYHSLCRQTCLLFDWLIVDDGSTDGTEQIVQQWIDNEACFNILYIKKENGGKNRAINDGVKLVKTPFTMIVDSDDYLTDDAILFLTEAANKIVCKVEIAGVAGLRGTNKDTPLKQPTISEGGCVIANNLERVKYNLDCDACEVYKTRLLQDHPFYVWPGENFVPEEIVWDKLALKGYRLQWYRRVTCIVRYQDKGFTKSSWKLQKENPMGYAMLYKHRVSLSKSCQSRFYWNCQLIAQCILGRHLNYGLQDNKTFSSFISLPFGFFLSMRRFIQYRKR